MTTNSSKKNGRSGAEYILCEQPDRERCEAYSRELKVPYPIAVLLWQRGICDAQEATRFLNPTLADLPSPFLLKDMDRAVALVGQALRENWPIYVHGDYDVDGVTGSALLARFFSGLGKDVTCYQPDRLTEGYGLQEGFIRNNAPQKDQSALLITVDCGISDFREVALAKELGFSVIVTDHHLPADELPPADALLNPHRKDCSFPFPDIAGVGVAFFLACGIRNILVEEGGLAKEKAPNLKKLMDLVAMGTVADVMPLTGINRILVRAGLEIMNQNDCSWVSALIGQQDNFIAGNPFTAEDISYRLAPRINAPGRLGKPELAFHLLASEDPQRCHELAAQIEGFNRSRRELELKALDQVLAECDRQDAEGASAFVVYGSFHQGVIGILASRVVDRYRKPVVIFTEDKSCAGTIKGSGRSINTVNLYKILQACSGHIVQFGGHAMAAGLTIEKNNLELFRDKFASAVAELNVTEVAATAVTVDYRPESPEIFDTNFLRYYKKMQPFGNGNPEPVFLLENPEFSSTGTVKGHLTYALRSNGQVLRGIGFGMADKIKFIQNGPVHLAFKLKSTIFRGEHRTELHTVSLMPTA